MVIVRRTCNKDYGISLILILFVNGIIRSYVGDFSFLLSQNVPNIIVNSRVYQAPAFFLTITGSTSPCPIMVISTTIVAIKIMVLRMGNGMPLSANLGSPIAIANDTMPRMPDQLMIKHSRIDSNAS